MFFKLVLQKYILKMSKMELVYDLHGIFLEDLDQIFDKRIYNAYLDGFESIKFITGSGKLQKRIIELCKIYYQFSYYIPMHNNGEIVILLDR